MKERLNISHHPVVHGRAHGHRHPEDAHGCLRGLIAHHSNSLALRPALAAMLCLLTCYAAPLRAAGLWQMVQQTGSDLLEFTAPKGGRHTLEIDDAFGFRTPVVKKLFSGSQLQVRGLELGLIPGIDYHARLDGGRDVKDFRMELNVFTEPEVSCANLRRTWETAERREAGRSHSGVEWDAGRRTWSPVASHPLIGAGLYYAEYDLSRGLNAARACRDLDIFDELSRYYVVMLQYTETIGTLLKRPDVLSVTKERMAAADLLARTFPSEINGKPADGELYIVQWLHTAADLLRFISLLPPDQRTPAMQNFAAQYTPFIVREQLDRYLVQQRLHLPGGGEGGRIELWKRDLAGLQGEDPWSNKVFDIDLWLMVSAADVLGANANDPALVPLTPPQSEMLRQALEVGTRFFESRRNDYPATKNFRGEQVGSVGYGSGDYIQHPDHAYDGVTSEKFPTPEEKRRNPQAGWNIAHASRLPVFMRTLYENRKATGVDWPSYHELQLFANQYMYRVFNGDFSRPLFHTHLDGSDGWYRVGYHENFGYPPSRYCDAHDPQHRPCMTPSSFMGWGYLAFASPDLAQLIHDLVKLALDANPQTQQFLDRYYYFNKQPFNVLGPAGQQTYAMALYYLIGDAAEMIDSRPVNDSR
jgi:hypothetical protein